MTIIFKILTVVVRFIQVNVKGWRGLWHQKGMNNHRIITCCKFFNVIMTSTPVTTIPETIEIFIPVNVYEDKGVEEK